MRIALNILIVVLIVVIAFMYIGNHFKSLESREAYCYLISLYKDDILSMASTDQVNTAHIDKTEHLHEILIKLKKEGLTNELFKNISINLNNQDEESINQFDDDYCVKIQTLKHLKEYFYSWNCYYMEKYRIAVDCLEKMDHNMIQLTMVVQTGLGCVISVAGEEIPFLKEERSYKYKESIPKVEYLLIEKLNGEMHNVKLFRNRKIYGN